MALKHTQLNEITLSGLGNNFPGGKNQPDVYMAWEKNSVSGTAKFTVKGNFPFASMKIESASKINEIDFYKGNGNRRRKPSN